MCLMMSEHVSVSVISTTMKVSRTIAISRELHFPEPRAREGPQLPQPEGEGGKAAFMGVRAARAGAAGGPETCAPLPRTLPLTPPWAWGLLV